MTSVGNLGIVVTLTPRRNLGIVVMVTRACWPVIMVMVTPTRALVIVVPIPAARRPVIVVVVTPASGGGFVVIATLADSGGIVGMRIVFGAQDLPRGGIDLHVDPVVQRDAVHHWAVLAVEIDLGDVRASLSLKRDLLGLPQIDARLQHRWADDGRSTRGGMRLMVGSCHWDGGDHPGQQHGCATPSDEPCTHVFLLSRCVRIALKRITDNHTPHPAAPVVVRLMERDGWSPPVLAATKPNADKMGACALLPSALAAPRVRSCLRPRLMCKWTYTLGVTVSMG
jgi:hypothetical protein